MLQKLIPFIKKYGKVVEDNPADYHYSAPDDYEYRWGGPLYFSFSSCAICDITTLKIWIFSLMQYDFGEPEPVEFRIYMRSPKEFIKWYPFYLKCWWKQVWRRSKPHKSPVHWRIQIGAFSFYMRHNNSYPWNLGPRLHLYKDPYWNGGPL